MQTIIYRFMSPLSKISVPELLQVLGAGPRVALFTLPGLAHAWSAIVCASLPLEVLTVLSGTDKATRPAVCYAAASSGLGYVDSPIAPGPSVGTSATPSSSVKDTLSSNGSPIYMEPLSVWPVLHPLHPFCHHSPPPHLLGQRETAVSGGRYCGHQW